MLITSSRMIELKTVSTTSLGSYRSVPFVRIEGEALGELSPTETIPDLVKAQRNARGNIEYKTRFILIAPENPLQSNGALLIDIPNRGLPISHAFYNSPRARPLMIGSLDAGIGFLQNQGFMTVAVQWELAQGIEPPCFVDDAGGKRFIEATGFAAVRDLARYLRDSQQSDNPLAGAVKRVLAAGYSQTSRFLKSFLLNGFNVVDGKQVVDGFHLVGGAAGQLPLMASGAGPASVASSTPAPPNLEHRGVHEEPFSYDEVVAKLRARGEPPPKIFVAHFHIDYMGGRASLTRTGAHGTTDIALPAEVRMYDLAGAAHLNVREKHRECELLHGQLDWSPPLRAQLVAMHQWVSKDIEPPPSCLMSLRLPRADESVFLAPQYLPGATVLVPRTDIDGNPIGGIQVPDVAVPLGTHGRPNGPSTLTVCRLAGSYQPFFSLKQEREQDQDPRLSLEERYPGGLNQYVQRVREVSDQLVVQRYLLAEDAAVIVNAAAEETLFKPTPTLAIFRTHGNLYQNHTNGTAQS